MARWKARTIGLSLSTPTTSPRFGTPWLVLEGGIPHLVLGVLAYPLDEAASGTTDLVRVTLHADDSISVEDNGRRTATRYDDAGNLNENSHIGWVASSGRRPIVGTVA